MTLNIETNLYNTMKTRILLALWFLFVSVCTYADKWITTCETNIWADTGRTTLRGQVSAGNEYEVLEQTQDGKWLCIDYFGERAYIALADCKRVAETATDNQIRTSDSPNNSVRKVDPAIQTRQASGEVQEVREYSSSMSTAQDTKATEDFQLSPVGETLVISFIVAVNIICWPFLIVLIIFAAMWTFNFGKLRSWINQKAGEDVVPDCRVHPLMWKGLWLYVGCAFCLLPGIIYAIYEYKKSLTHRSTRATRWRAFYVAYATLTCAIIFAITCWVIVIFLAIGMGGKIADYALKSDQSAKPATDNGLGAVCGNCGNYRTNGCPYYGDINLNRMTDSCNNWRPQ